MADTNFKHYKINTLNYDVVIVGTGAAGYNSANRLFESGIRNIAIVSEDIKLGTSRNAGSDKQTYYKLSMESSENDSVDKMAKVYFDGLHMHGDLAKVEAAESIRAFMNLVELGVEFPHNEYGEYIGYKTDHDPNKRATSAGPYTSKQMTEKLEEKAKSYGFDILNNNKLIKIFTEDNCHVAILTYNRGKYNLIYSNSLILATGGPANLYLRKVYPNGQKGAAGIAFEAGIEGKNLTHFQYGLSSVSPKWNVSGTYMQAMPRFYSVDEDGNEHDFLEEFYDDCNLMLKNIFLKGYQWPFDVKKIKGSSMIDYLVYKEEVEHNRRVYLDFRKNPSDKTIDFSLLDDEVRTYISSNEAELETPILRLRQMNEKAYDFYMDHNVDLEVEPLEISLCAQHNNGGLGVDINYQTNVKNIYTVGEAAGTHGIYRPGGSALNSGQVGSKRTAENIYNHFEERKDVSKENEANDFISKFTALITDTSNIDDLIYDFQREMTDYAAAFRKLPEINEMIDSRLDFYGNFFEKVKIKDYELIKAYEFYNILIGQIVYLKSMADYAKKIDAMVGGSIYYNDYIEFDNEGNFVNEVQVSIFEDGKVKTHWEKVEDIPSEDKSFEIQWKKYQQIKANKKEVQ